ncbi:hypothetical protein LEP1GSC081_0702 [Leptospira kirschneri str. H1]|uniref:Uncharacterized protein n=1 Tax=Leptospira kirschneri str. H1 TaxID=1049966 RepID=A0A0E2B6L2_9LEPT|nr:hypothetical protein LEP1GSC081_0702 [Leptospira kirschneri str. H1]
MFQSTSFLNKGRNFPDLKSIKELAVFQSTSFLNKGRNSGCTGSN